MPGLGLIDNRNQNEKQRSRNLECHKTKHNIKQ